MPDHSQMRIALAPPLLCAFALFLIAGCGQSPGPILRNPPPLPAANINLIFVVSPDLEYQGAGDVQKDTANLTSQGLERSLLMAPFLQQDVLGNNNVTAIYALEPMTHLQTVNGYPDMAALETIQQFDMLNQITTTSGGPGTTATPGQNFPINASYALGSVPTGVAMPSAAFPCPNCQGIDFNDLDADNETLLTGIVNANVPGYYVFSAPWEPTSAMLAKLNAFRHYGLAIPASYQSPNLIYAISIAPSGSATIATYNSKVTPPTTYPVLPSAPLVPSACEATPFAIPASGPALTGAPANINTRETVYFIRHANAHPTATFSDGNYVAAGQWRALDLVNALKGKVNPSHVYSMDPAQVTNGSFSASDQGYWSHNTLALTAQPYAIANNLPFTLVSNFLLTDANGPQETSTYFFQNGEFSNQTILVAWEHSNIPMIVQQLLASYGSTAAVPGWGSTDYDSIWTVKLDAVGNLTVDNSLCEGIDSALLPKYAPQF